MDGLILNWSSLQRGQTASLVASMVTYDRDQRNHLMCATIGKRLFTFHGKLPADMLTYSLLNVEVWDPLPRPLLFGGSDSHVLLHGCCDWDSVHENIEICAGLGGLGLGGLSTGFVPKAACDVNPLMLEMYKTTFGIPCICGDICNVETVAKIWEACPRSTCLSAGIACQPYSALGDGRSAQDPRSTSLPGTLAAAHYLRSVAIILECVQPAQNDPYVVQQVGAFCKATGFYKSEVLLQLSHAWPCSRNRWWCVLTAPSLGPINLKALPMFHDVTKICHVVQSIQPWPTAHETVLRLQAHEIEAFSVDDLGSSPYMMDCQGVLPCPLHSWGSQLRPCPCLCRMTGLSTERLKKKGLFGVLVRSAMPGSIGAVRHIHPLECAALVGFDPTVQLGDATMLQLAGMGQIASPIHSAWIFGHIAMHLDLLQFGVKTFEPIEHLKAYRAWQLMKCQNIWEAPAGFMQGHQIANDMELFRPFAHVPLDFFLGFDWWTAPRSVMCLAAALHQLREGPMPSVERVLDTIALIPENTDTVDQETSDDSPPTCQIHDGSTIVAVAVSSEATVADVGRAEGSLMGWSGVCIRHLDQKEDIQPADRAEGCALTIMPADCAPDAASGCDHWCFVPVPVPGEQATQVDIRKDHDHACDMSPQSPAVGIECITFIDDPSRESTTSPAVKDEGCHANPLPHMQPPDVTSAAALRVSLPPPDMSETQPAGMSATVFDHCPMLDNAPVVSACPLVHLNQFGLCSLGTPFPLSQMQLDSLHTQVISSQDRLCILHNQGMLCADDEVTWHSMNIVAAAQVQRGSDGSPVKPIVLLPTMLLHGWTHACVAPMKQWLSERYSEGSPIVGIFNIDGHWIPMIVFPGVLMHVHTFDNRDADHAKLGPVLEVIAEVVQAKDVAVNRAVGLFPIKEGCGTMAVAFLAHILLHKMLPVTPDDMTQTHVYLKDLFSNHIGDSALCLKPWMWGNGGLMSLHAPAVTQPDTANLETQAGLSWIDGPSAPCVASHDMPSHEDHMPDRPTMPKRPRLDLPLVMPAAATQNNPEHWDAEVTDTNPSASDQCCDSSETCLVGHATEYRECGPLPCKLPVAADCGEGDIFGLPVHVPDALSALSPRGCSIWDFCP